MIKTYQYSEQDMKPIFDFIDFHENNCGKKYNLKRTDNKTTLECSVCGKSLTVNHTIEWY